MTMNWKVIAAMVFTAVSISSCDDTGDYRRHWRDDDSYRPRWHRPYYDRDVWDISNRPNSPNRPNRPNNPNTY